MVICLERDADLRVAQRIPLPLTVSCFSKIQVDFTFLVPPHPGSPGQRAIKRVCVCVCVCVYCIGKLLVPSDRLIELARDLWSTGQSGRDGDQQVQQQGRSLVVSGHDPSLTRRHEATV